MTASLAQTAYIFKINYAGAVGDVALRMHPTLGKTQKGSKAKGHAGPFVGISFNYPMRFGNPQSVSGSFANAQTAAAATTTRGVQFAASRFIKYGDILIDGPSLHACENDGAFLDLVTLETDSVITEHIDREAFDLFRVVSGVRGRRASAATNIIQLATVDDARNFKVDMVVFAAAAADGTTPRTGTTTVAGVNLSLGQITLTSAAAITGFVDNDFLFNNGDIGTCMEGMETCTPLTSPAPAESFRGRDRSVFPELLAGSRLTTLISLNQTIEESIGQAAIAVNACGGHTNTAVLNPINFWAVVRRGNARVEPTQAGGEMTYGFETAKIATPAGTLSLWSDPDCPIDRVRGFDDGSHYIRTLGEFVHVINDDGNYNLRSVNADSIEARTRSMKNYIQNNTRNHFVAQI